MRFLKKVGGRGTVVLPSDLREAMDIAEGDIVEFELVGVVRRANGTTETIPAEQTAQNPDSTA